MPEIIMTIAKDGSRCTVEVNGVVGSECQALTAPITAGDTIEQTTLKPEYDDSHARTVAQKVTR